MLQHMACPIQKICLQATSSRSVQHALERMQECTDPVEDLADDLRAAHRLRADDNVSEPVPTVQGMTNYLLVCQAVCCRSQLA